MSRKDSFTAKSRFVAVVHLYINLVMNFYNIDNIYPFWWLIASNFVLTISGPAEGAVVKKTAVLITPRLLQVADGTDKTGRYQPP